MTTKLWLPLLLLALAACQPTDATADAIAPAPAVALSRDASPGPATPALGAAVTLVCHVADAPAGNAGNAYLRAGVTAASSAPEPSSPQQSPSTAHR